MYFDEATLISEKDQYQSCARGKGPDDLCRTIDELIALASSIKKQMKQPKLLEHRYSPPKRLSKTNKKSKLWTVSKTKGQKHNQEDFRSLVQNCTMLTLASYFSDDNSYADHAVSIIKEWFLDQNTKVNPSKVFTEATHRLLKTTYVYTLFDSLRLLRKKGRFSEDEWHGLQRWFTQVMEAMDQSARAWRLGYTSKDHIGLYYDIQYSSIAAFINNSTQMYKTIQDSIARLYEHVAPDGTLHNEITKKSCESNQIFALAGWQTMDRMASKLGIDLWNQAIDDSDKYSRLCRTMVTTISYLSARPRLLCEGPEPSDERIWWPLIHGTIQHCPTEMFQGYSSEWFLQKSAPESKYDMPSVFHHEDGFASFWNLGNADP